jgi:hypothetical protein
MLSFLTRSLIERSRICQTQNHFGMRTSSASEYAHKHQTEYAAMGSKLDHDDTSPQSTSSELISGSPADVVIRQPRTAPFAFPSLYNPNHTCCQGGKTDCAAPRQSIKPAIYSQANPFSP